MIFPVLLEITRVAEVMRPEITALEEAKTVIPVELAAFGADVGTGFLRPVPRAESLMVIVGIKTRVDRYRISSAQSKYYSIYRKPLE
jgi:hypothetical protein